MRLTTHLRRYAWDLYVNGVIPSVIVPRPLRWRLLRLLGIDVKRSAIASGGHWGGRAISVDRGSFLNKGVFIDNAAPVTIGKRCQIGMQAMIITGSHWVGDHEQRAVGSVAKSVTICDGSWIGARAIILPGVTVGRGCIIAAGAIVTKDCQPDGVYAGVPARRVRDLD